MSAIVVVVVLVGALGCGGVSAVAPDGGSAGIGGGAGTGGSAGTGGAGTSGGGWTTAGDGGAAAGTTGAGGATGAAGASGAAGTTGAAGTGAATACEITATWRLSSMISCDGVRENCALSCLQQSPDAKDAAVIGGLPCAVPVGTLVKNSSGGAYPSTSAFRCVKDCSQCIPPTIRAAYPNCAAAASVQAGSIGYTGSKDGIDCAICTAGASGCIALSPNGTSAYLCVKSAADCPR